MEHSLKGPRVAVEPSKGTTSMSGFRSRDYRRYTLGMSSNQDFKGHYGGPSSRQYNSGSTSQRKSQRTPNQPIRLMARSRARQKFAASAGKGPLYRDCGRVHQGSMSCWGRSVLSLQINKSL